MRTTRLTRRHAFPLAAVAMAAAFGACGDRTVVSRVLVSGLPEAAGVRPAAAKTRALISREVGRARGYTLATDAPEGWTFKVDLHRVTDAAVQRDDPPAIEIRLHHHNDAGALDSYATAVALSADDRKLAASGGLSEERVAALVAEGLRMLKVQMDFRRMPQRDLVAALAEKEAWRREFAVEELGRRGEKESTAALLLKLKDPEKAVAMKAVGALVAVGDPAVVPALIEFAKGKDAVTQIQMIYAISQLGGRTAEAYLFVLSTGHPDPQIAHAAKEAYDEIETKKGRGRLRRSASE